MELDQLPDVWMICETGVVVRDAVCALWFRARALGRVVFFDFGGDSRVSGDGSHREASDCVHEDRSEKSDPAKHTHGPENSSAECHEQPQKRTRSAVHDFYDMGDGAAVEDIETECRCRVLSEENARRTREELRCVSDTGQHSVRSRFSVAAQNVWTELSTDEKRLASCVLGVDNVYRIMKDFVAQNTGAWQAAMATTGAPEQQPPPLTPPSTSLPGSLSMPSPACLAPSQNQPERLPTHGEERSESAASQRSVQRGAVPSVCGKRIPKTQGREDENDGFAETRYSKNVAGRATGLGCQALCGRTGLSAELLADVGRCVWYALRQAAAEQDPQTHAAQQSKTGYTVSPCATERDLRLAQTVCSELPSFVHLWTKTAAARALGASREGLLPVKWQKAEGEALTALHEKISKEGVSARFCARRVSAKQEIFETCAAANNDSAEPSFTARYAKAKTTVEQLTRARVEKVQTVASKPTPSA